MGGERDSHKPAGVGGAGTSQTHVAALVLAAGAGRRFGGRKQLAHLAGRPLLEHALATAESSSVDRTVVVLGAYADEILAEVDLHAAEPVICEEWERGMSASLRAGVRALSGAHAIVIALGDQPFVTAAAIDRLIAARGGGAEATRATYGGVPGHPVLIEATLYDRLLSVGGDKGARELLASVAVREVGCDYLGSQLDVDTREELERVDSIAPPRELGAPAGMGGSSGTQSELTRTQRPDSTTNVIMRKPMAELRSWGGRRI